MAKQPLLKKLRSLPSVDMPLLLVTTVLVIFGLIMMLSASYAYAYYWHGDSFYYIKDQLVFAVIGFALMMIVSHIDYRVLKKFAWILYIVSTVLLFVTLFMPARNNARRWIIIGSFQFQPSEITKFAIILLFSYLASRRPEMMKKFGYGYLEFLGLLLIDAAIMLKQPHISGTILVCLIGIILMFVGGSKLRWFAITAGVVVPAGVGYVLLTHKLNYAIERVRTWLDPFTYSSDEGYQTVQSLLAIGSGGLFGLGLGNSRQKHLYVPEPQNDFIFSIICEELGYVGALFVIALFAYFIFRGFSIALHAKDKFGALMAIGITAQVGLQAMLNIAVVTNTVPNTGISLPFFSQGGTSLVILLCEVGVLLSISRYSKIDKT